MVSRWTVAGVWTFSLLIPVALLAADAQPDPKAKAEDFAKPPAAAATAKAAPAAGAKPAAGVDSKKRQAAIDKAVAYLNKAQADNGSWSGTSGTGITSVAAAGLLQNGVSAADPAVAKALKFLEANIRDDGGIYFEKSTHKNYETALAIICFAKADANKYKKVIAAADKFLRGEQWDESEQLDKSHVNYGGAGYGSKKRPDLSNTQFLLDALKAAGAGADDQAIQRALVFVSRTQNLESEHNTTPHPAKASKEDEGGFYYTPANDGESQAGQNDAGGLRSYASMTYAGLKSFIYAGLKKDDPRVKAAVKWLSRNYKLGENPGMGASGLYYYYHTFAKSLDAYGDGLFEDDKGVKHNWRAELVEELAGKQKADGSWVNEQVRWLEGDPNLVTGYALLALSYCQEKK